MDFITVREAAKRWHISERLVQQYCQQGRVEGARKFNGSWAIPENAVNPKDLQKSRSALSSSGKEPHVVSPSDLPDPGMTLMPLLNTAFPPGRCKEYLEYLKAGPQRDIAMAEYHYFSGHPQEAAQEAELFLTSSDLRLRLSACWIYAYANLSMGQINRARFALSQVNRMLTEAGEQSPPLQAAAAFVAAAAAVLLHLPLPEDLPPTNDFFPLLSPGLRVFALYVQAHYRYLQGDYGVSAGMVEAACSMGAERYPISAIYLHLVAVMDYMSMKQTENAKAHLLTAWNLAQPDDLIEGFGEHHGLLGGMLEAVLKPEWPEDFKRIIEITYQFSAGWRKVHNPDTGHDVADNLTTTEFATCMLAARGWTNQEIGEHMKISPNTVKRYISSAMDKLHISHRKELKQYMLR